MEIGDKVEQVAAAQFISCRECCSCSMSSQLHAPFSSSSETNCKLPSDCPNGQVSTMTIWFMVHGLGCMAQW